MMLSTALTGSCGSPSLLSWRGSLLYLTLTMLLGLGQMNRKGKLILLHVAVGCRFKLCLNGSFSCLGHTWHCGSCLLSWKSLLPWILHLHSLFLFVCVPTGLFSKFYWNYSSSPLKYWHFALGFLPCQSKSALWVISASSNITWGAVHECPVPDGTQSMSKSQELCLS